MLKVVLLIRTSKVLFITMSSTNSTKIVITCRGGNATLVDLAIVTLAEEQTFYHQLEMTNDKFKEESAKAS